MSDQEGVSEQISRKNLWHWLRPRQHDGKCKAERAPPSRSRSSACSAGGGLSPAPCRTDHRWLSMLRLGRLSGRCSKTHGCRRRHPSGPAAVEPDSVLPPSLRRRRPLLLWLGARHRLPGQLLRRAPRCRAPASDRLAVPEELLRCEDRELDLQSQSTGLNSARGVYTYGNLRVRSHGAGAPGWSLPPHSRSLGQLPARPPGCPSHPPRPGSPAQSGSTPPHPALSPPANQRTLRTGPSCPAGSGAV